jgi:hypothetical protein
MKEASQDRVTYSFGMKVGLPNYSSADFHVGFSSDVGPGETREKAFARIKKFVDAQAEKELNEIHDLSGKKD